MADISKIKLPNNTTYDINAATVNGHTVDKNVPSNAVFTDTNTKVTSVGNHYAPTEDSSATLSADASSTTAATWNSTSLVTGVDIKRDAKGHVTGVTVDSIKMPSNPDTNTHRPIKVNGSQILGNNTTPFNLVSGDNVHMAITGSGSVTIHADQIDDSYTYSQYQDLPSTTKMQDKIFMVKDAPNPPAIPVVDEYAREQIVDVKSNLTNKLNGNWTLIKTVTKTGSTSITIPSTAKEVMATIVTNSGFYDYKIINASDIIAGSNRIFGVAFFQSSTVYAFARMTITPTSWNVLAIGAQNLGTAVSSVSLYYR